MTKKRVIIWLIGWIIIYVVFFKILPKLADDHQGCYVHKDIYGQTLNSVVFKKFIDSTNHGEETIVFFNESKNEETMIFNPEFGSMYSFIDLGDSIIKKKNTVYYRVRKNTTGKDTVFKFYTSCKDSLKK